MSARNILITALIFLNIAIDQISKFIVRAEVGKGSVSEIFGEFRGLVIFYYRL